MKAQGHSVKQIGFDQKWATKARVGFLNKLNLACENCRRRPVGKLHKLKRAFSDLLQNKCAKYDWRRQGLRPRNRTLMKDYTHKERKELIRFYSISGDEMKHRMKLWRAENKKQKDE